MVSVLDKEYTFYALKKGETIVYVGKTKNPKSRFDSHRQDKTVLKKDFDNHSILEVKVCSVLESNEIENDYIKQLDPIYNKRLNGFGDYIRLENFIDSCDLDEYEKKKLLYNIKGNELFNNNFARTFLKREYKKIKGGIK